MPIFVPNNIVNFNFQFAGNGFNTPLSTEDPLAPFRNAPTTQKTTTTEYNQFQYSGDYNQFQNNEVGSRDGPYDTFQSDYERNNVPRLQVDEFGNHLGEIHNVDTTRFELGVGVRSEDLR